MREFSTIGSGQADSDSMKAYYNKPSRLKIQHLEVPTKMVKNVSVVSQNYLQQYNALLKSAKTLEFNVLDFSRQLKQKTLPVLTYSAFSEMDLCEAVDETKLGLFLNNVA